MIFTADKERDIIDRLTGENRALKEQINGLQLELETKKENYNRSSIVFKEEIEYQRKEKEKYFREIENITNLYNKQIKELKEENEKQKELIEAPKNAEIILAELTNMIYTIEETTMKINKLLERESHNG
nr:MAG TPA: hypothetical protein [Caudoviricetes sp.]